MSRHLPLRKPTRSDIDRTCPINWDHSLNRGLIGEWAAVIASGYWGGTTVRDLVRGSKAPHDAKFNAFYATSAWGGPFRPGSYARFTQTDPRQFLSLSSTLSVGNSNTSGTFVAWIYSAAGWSHFRDLYIVEGSDHFHAMSAVNNSNNGQILTGSVFDNSLGALNISSSAGILPSNTPIFCAFTFDNTTGLNLYQGTQTQLPSNVGTHAGGLSIQSMAVSTLWAYSDQTQGQADWNGPYSADEILVYNRALSAGEILNLYIETVKGNPSRWRWTSKTTWSMPHSVATPSSRLLRFPTIFPTTNIATVGGIPAGI